jgi:hypothetical protein
VTFCGGIAGSCWTVDRAARLVTVAGSGDGLRKRRRKSKNPLRWAQGA